MASTTDWIWESRSLPLAALTRPPQVVKGAREEMTNPSEEQRSLQDFAQAMKRDWDERAREWARYL